MTLAVPKLIQYGGVGIGLILSATLLVRAVLSAVEKGEDLANAKWEATLALKEIEARDRIEAAREAGRAEGETARADAERRAVNALRALNEARNADPKFDEAMRVRWPDSYFASVCGERPGCRPPNRND